MMAQSRSMFYILAVFLLCTLVHNSPVNAAVCDSRPLLKLYAGYASKGQANLKSAVRGLQKILVKKGGYNIDVDGLFGPATQRAVKNWQGKKKLTVDGIVGPNTWKSLCGSSPPSKPPPSSGTCGSLRNPHKSGRNKNTGGTWNPITKFVVKKLKACFPGKITECTTRNAGPKSDHAGNAADCFPDKFGVVARGQEKKDGDKMAAWLVKNARSLKVKYVIWYARIWSQARSREGWRKCGTSAAGCYGGSDPTLAHKDHIHVSVL